jgi:hypothetical protein
MMADTIGTGESPDRSRLMARLIAVSAIYPFHTIANIPCGIEEGEAMADTINRQQSVIGRPALATCIPDFTRENESSNTK